jgi:preprotein translocase subunit YajC
VGFLLMMVVLFGLMWFLLIRPQQRKQRQTASMLQSLAVGQEVMTAGGLYGNITDLDIEEVILEIAPGVSVRVDKRAIVNVIEEELEEDAEDGAEPEEPAEVPVEEAQAPIEAEQR